MRVLFICHALSRNGASMALLQEVRYLRENYKDMYIEVLSQTGGPLLEEFKEICPTYCIKYGRFHHIKQRLWKMFFKRPWLYGYKKGSFDVVYANTINSYPTAILFKNALGIPVLMHFHEASINKHRIQKGYLQFTAIEAIIAVSERTKKFLVDSFSISPSTIYVQYPISPIASILMNDNSLLASKRDKGDTLNIGLCGVYRWVKSSDLLPLIIKRFFTKYPDDKCHFTYICRFYGIEEEDNKAQLEYDLHQIDMEDRLTLIQETDNPITYFQNFDILLIPSREESFALVGQEAALMGIPVVGFQGVMGLEEWLKDEGGIFVPYLDLDKLADALHLLYTDKELRLRIGSCGKRIAREKCEEASKMENVIQAIKSLTVRT